MSRRIVWIDHGGVASADESAVMFIRPSKIAFADNPVKIQTEGGEYTPFAAWSCGSVRASLEAMDVIVTCNAPSGDIMVGGSLVAEYIGGGSEWPRKIPKE